MSLISTTQFTAGKAAVQGKFGKLTLRESREQLSGMVPSTVKAELAWIYTFALETYDPTPDAINYITEEQVVTLIAKAHAL